MHLDLPIRSRSVRSSPPIRRSVLVALFGAEGWLLGGRIRATAPIDLQRWWDRLNGMSWVMTRPAIAVAVATLLIGIAWGRGDARRGGELMEGHGRSWPLLLVHLIAFVGCAGLTSVVFMEDSGSSPRSAIEVVAWATLGVATLGSWTAMVALSSPWEAGARRGSMALVAGTAVGVVAVTAGRISDGFWHPLSRCTLWAASGLLGLVCPDSICLPKLYILGTKSFAVVIDPPCSGYAGIGLISVFLGVYLWFFRRDHRFPRSFLLLPLGAAVMWLANVVRIVGLLALGTWISPAVADRGFHTHAGWLAFNSVGLGLVLGIRHLRYFTVADLHTERARSSNPAVAYLVPLLSIIATTMFTGVFSDGFDRLYPLRVLAAAGALWLFRGDYAGWRWSWSWEVVAIGIGAFALWMALEPTPRDTGAGSSLAEGLAGLSRVGVVTWLGFRIIGSVVTVPLAEELAFRGYLTRRLIAADFQDVAVGRFTAASFLCSSILFGAMHGRWLAGTLAGMLYALALYRRGRLADAVLAHATTNTMIAIYVLATGSWSLWV
jgi:exosortase E/protease (VPEID-CTERM system)